MTRHFFLLLTTGMALAACNDTRNLAPETPAHSWHPVTKTGLVLPPSIRTPTHVSPDGSGAVATGQARTVLPEAEGKPVSLVELIDLAERNNPQTRITWEAARQAAISVGLSRAALLPQLTLSAMGGYQRQALPLPNYLSERGYLTSNSATVLPKLQLEYLLLDFGRTKAQVHEAKFQSLAANFGFSAMHQQLILDVINAYYSYQAAQAVLKASHTSVDNMALLFRAAQSRHDHGEATIVDVATSDRNLAQARFDLNKAENDEHLARHALLEVAGLPATMPLSVEPMVDRELPHTSPEQIKQLVDQALSSRPDLLADIAKFRAQEEAVKSSKAALKPQISVATSITGFIGSMKTYGTGRSAPASTIAQPEAGAYLQFNWPIYQGGSRTNAIHMAESRRDAAEATLLKDRLSVERQVADSQDNLETALAQVKSAKILSKAAQTANDSAAQAYIHGVGTMTDASTAAATLFQAQASLAVSITQACTKAASLAYATGQLDLRGKTPDGMAEEIP